MRHTFDVIYVICLSMHCCPVLWTVFIQCHVQLTSLFLRMSSLPLAILASFEQVPYSLWARINQLPVVVRRLSFAIVLLHGCLVARQLFGSAGLSRWYPFDSMLIVSALELLFGRDLTTTEGSQLELDVLFYHLRNVSRVVFMCSLICVISMTTFSSFVLIVNCGIFLFV